MRITKYTLRDQCVRLNDVLLRSQEPMAIGHFSIDKNSLGYQLEEELNGSGAVTAHSTRITAREMGYLMAGMIRGASLGRFRVS
jgi:hypothetical protein